MLDKIDNEFNWFAQIILLLFALTLRFLNVKTLFINFLKVWIFEKLSKSSVWESGAKFLLSFQKFREFDVNHFFLEVQRFDEK